MLELLGDAALVRRDTVALEEVTKIQNSLARYLSRGCLDQIDQVPTSERS